MPANLLNLLSYSRKLSKEYLEQLYTALEFEYIQDANNGDKQRVEVGADLDLEETNCASIEALFWDVDGKARDGVLYYRMTENGVEDYE